MQCILSSFQELMSRGLLICSFVCLFGLWQLPVALHLVSSLSSLMLQLPQDLRPLKARQAVLMQMEAQKMKWEDGFPPLDPLAVSLGWGMGDGKGGGGGMGYGGWGGGWVGG